jgi:hypothetical protein
MQGYQSHTALASSHCPSALNSRQVERLAVEEGKPLCLMHKSAFGSRLPAVPVSPGHGRRLHPYPPSRRRRR